MKEWRIVSTRKHTDIDIVQGETLAEALDNWYCNDPDGSRLHGNVVSVARMDD